MTVTIASILITVAALVRGIYRRFAAAQHAQVELWERYLRRQRPWEPQELRWVRAPDGWHLDGDFAPGEELRTR